MPLLIFCGFNASAAPTNNKFWSLFTVNGNNGSALYMVEPQIRFVDHRNKYELFMFNSGLGLPVTSEWQAWLGTTYLNHGPITTGNNNEFRLWEQLIWQRSNAIKNLSFLSRTRLEQRRSFNFSALANRLRERFIITLALNEQYNLITYDEFFINFNRVVWVRAKTIDQNRAYIALEQVLRPNLAFNIGYLHQYIFIPGGLQSNVILLGGRINIT